MVDMGQADRSLRQSNVSIDEGVFQRHKERVGIAKINTVKEFSDWVEKTWNECKEKAWKENV